MVANSGSLAAADATWTPGAGAIGQSDSMGANEAYLFDAAASRVVGPTSTVFNNASVFTIGIKVKATSDGEATNGYMWADNGSNRLLQITVGGASPFRLALSVWCSIAYAQIITSAGNGVILNQDMWLFATYNDAGDRLPHLYYGYNVAVVEASYAVSTPGAAALANGIGPLLIGDTTASNRSWGGLIGEFFFKSGLILTTAQMLDIVKTTGV